MLPSFLYACTVASRPDWYPLVLLQIVPIHYDIRNDALLAAALARSNVVINLLGEPATPALTLAPAPFVRSRSAGMAFW